MPEEVLTEIEKVLVQAALSILQGKGLQFILPSRNKQNQEYVEEVNRLVLKTTAEAMMSETLLTPRSRKNLHHDSRTRFSLSCLEARHSRDEAGSVYSDVNLFKKQSQVIC